MKVKSKIKQRNSKKERDPSTVLELMVGTATPNPDLHGLTLVQVPVPENQQDIWLTKGGQRNCSKWDFKWVMLGNPDDFIYFSNWTMYFIQEAIKKTLHMPKIQWSI